MAKPNRKAHKAAFQEAEQRIQKALQSGATILDLSSLGLTALPESIVTLTQLQELYVHNNQLTALPESISGLTRLQELFVPNNQLTGLPESIGALTQLQSLDVSGNQLTALPESIAALTQLKMLTVWENQLTALPESIAALTQLKMLTVWENQLTALPESIAALTQLQSLDVDNNRLKGLPESIAALTKLQSLFVSNNRLTALPESIAALTQLQTLTVSNNQLTALPESIGALTKLQTLNVNNNQLAALPESLRGVKSLTELFLHGNDALGLPPEVLGPKWYEVDSEKKSAKPADILDYYFRIRAGKRPLNEAKLILVGRGGAGKTCVIKRLIHRTFDEHEQETPGIEIRPWEITLPDGDNVRLHVWDFGGQEILHATHQFFLTERTVYLLVLSGREGNPSHDAEYWLQLIRSFGGDSRVIIALNKSVQHPFDVNRGLLQEKYPFIADFVKTDCKDPALGFDKLKQLVFQETGSLEHRKKGFPAEWFEIKERLAGMSENYVTWEEFQEICRARGVDDAKSQKELAGFLHILGIALNYRDDPRLRETHVLNPRWVTEGIYTLLRAGQKEERKAVLAKSDLGAILNTKSYPPSRHDFLLRLMEKFHLCFELTGNQEKYLVPELLNENQPDLVALLDSPGLGFRFQYEVLPEGMLPRFIVQSHALSEANPHLRWRTGVVLQRDGCHAVVRADHRERRVDVHIIGAEPRRRGVLAIIREKFDEQHRELKGLRVDERVPVDKTGVTVSYRDLLKREDRGEVEFYPENLDYLVYVQELLDGIESPADRKARRDKDAEFKRVEIVVQPGGYLNIEGDPMEKISGGKYTQKITGGTFNQCAVASQQTLENCFSTIQQVLNPELKAKLEELTTHAGGLLAKLEAKQDNNLAAETRENLETLVKEAAKSEPRRKWFDLSSEGLIEAAKTVKEISGPIISVVTSLGKMLFG